MNTVERPKVYHKEEEFCSANILLASITHNGFQGGDAGHGGFVNLKFIDLASTSMEINGEDVREINITFRGDTERETLLDALKMFVRELEHNK